MGWTIESSIALAKVRGSDDYKMKYFIKNSETEKEYVVLRWDNSPCIIYNKEFDQLISKNNWVYQFRTGYVYSSDKENQLTMHRLIMDELNIPKPPKTNIDHINHMKTFNIIDNLRYATESEQMVNRTSRSDKKDPPQALLDIGITELPRHIRYDNSESKFIIERKKHPGVQTLDALGIKFNCSGTKSVAFSVIYKYYDILKKVEQINQLADPEKVSFIEKQKELYKEYQEITFLITGKVLEDRTFEEDYGYSHLEKYLTPEELEHSCTGKLPKGKKNSKIAIKTTVKDPLGR
jgi:hypothetical protein